MNTLIRLTYKYGINTVYLIDIQIWFKSSISHWHTRWVYEVWWTYPNDTFHKCFCPEIPQIEKLRFLGTLNFFQIAISSAFKWTKTFPFFGFAFVPRDTKESQFSDSVDSRNLAFSLEHCHFNFLWNWCYTPEIHRIEKLTHCVRLVCCWYMHLLCHSNNVIIPYLYVSLMGIHIAGEYTHLRLISVCMSIWHTVIIPYLSVIRCQKMITLIFALTRPHFFHKNTMQTRT